MPAYSKADIQRRMNGAPLQKNTGVVSRSWSQPETPRGMRFARPGQIISPIFSMACSFSPAALLPWMLQVWSGPSWPAALQSARWNWNW